MFGWLWRWCVFVALVLGFLSLGAVLLIALACGIGAGLTLLVPFSWFECSLLGLLGVVGSVLILQRFIEGMLWSPVPPEALDEVEAEEEEEDFGPVIIAVGRNEPCPCGSGKKFKRCCVPKGASDGNVQIIARSQRL